MNQANTGQGISDLSDKKILIVEDIESNYLLLKEYLRPTKAEILWASRATAAIEFCRNDKDIDIVLMDIYLPDISGYDATRMIKEFRRDLPIIAQTAFAMLGDKEKCLDAGCEDYISKPISRTDLIAIIIKYLFKSPEKQWFNGY